MDNSSTEVRQHEMEHAQYNDIPVEYCAHCLSLAIMDIEGTPYCSKCGSTDIKKADIFDWEKIYAAKYAGKYLDLGK